MFPMHVSRILTIPIRRSLLLFAIVLCPLLLLASILPAGAAESAIADQCIACHTDAAKLKALTPPDPPSSEEGEG